jgi:hypothetical protein
MNWSGLAVCLAVLSLRGFIGAQGQSTVCKKSFLATVRSCVPVDSRARRAKTLLPRLRVYAPMRSLTLTRFCTVAAGLLLDGCTIYSGGLQTGGEPRPKIVLVSDFTFSSDIVAIDRGYTARLERKVGTYPTHERRPRTTERVNDEIVATIVASLREAGLDAQPGAEDTVTLNQSALVVSGGLRPGEPVTAKNKNSFGFGAGRGHVAAAVNASLFSSGSKRQVLAFDVEPSAKREPAVPPKVAAARNAEIAGIVASTGSPNERLSPDVEAAARRLGHAIADQVLVYAREHGWLSPPGQGVAEAPPKNNADNPSEAAPEPGVERPGT